MQFTLSSPGAQEWVATRWQNMRPWMAFCNTNSFQVTATVPKLSKRVLRNIGYFQTNYMAVFIFLLVYCIVTSPLLLVAMFVSLGACYIISIRSDSPLRVLGKELTLTHQYALVGIGTFPLLWLAGAGSIVFWVLGASLFVIVLHASLFNIEAVLDAPEEEFTAIVVDDV